MSIFDLFKNDAGNRAYRIHSQANRLNDMGKVEQAEAMYKKAMSLYEEAEVKGFQNAKLITGYCVLLMREGKFGKAREFLEVLFTDSTVTSADLYFLEIDHAVCSWKLGELDAGIERMKKCGEHQKIGLYYNVLGAMLVEKAAQTGDFTETQKFIADAVDYDDDDISTIDNQGWLSYYTGDKASARKWFDKAVAKNSRYSPALSGLALISHEEGDSFAARDYINRALAVHFPTTSPVSRKWAEELQKKIG